MVRVVGTILLLVVLFSAGCQSATQLSPEDLKQGEQKQQQNKAAE